MTKNVQTTTHLHSFSHTVAKECSKFSKPGINSTGTENFEMFQELVMDREAWRAAVFESWGLKESNMTEQLN